MSPFFAGPAGSEEDMSDDDGEGGAEPQEEVQDDAVHTFLGHSGVPGQTQDVCQPCQPLTVLPIDCQLTKCLKLMLHILQSLRRCGVLCGVESLVAWHCRLWRQRRHGIHISGVESLAPCAVA